MKPGVAKPRPVLAGLAPGTTATSRTEPFMMYLLAKAISPSGTS